MVSRTRSPCLDAPSPRFGAGAFCAVLLVAGSLMFIRLGSRSLWQDEGETAVLARSILSHGIPVARFGENLVLQDEVGYDEQYRWTFHPWGQFYLAAAGLGLMGPSELAVRAPFALCGVLAVGLLYVFVWRVWRDRLAAAVCALSLATAPTFVLHARQCRYYSLSALTCLLVVFLLVEVMSRPRAAAGLALGAALAAQFYADFGTLVGIAPGLLILVALLRPTRRAMGPLAIAFIVSALLIAPGIRLHWDRLTHPSASQVEWPIKLAAHLAYLDGWCIPVGMMLVGGAMILWKRVREGTELSTPHRVALGCGTMVLSSAIVLSWPAPYPHMRYIISTIPFCKLLLGLGLVWGYRWTLYKVGSRAGAAVCAGAGFAILNWTNTGALPGQWAATRPYQQTPDFCTGAPAYFRCDGAGLAAELVSDFPCANRIARNAAADLARKGDMVLVSYGDLPLMFHRPDVAIRGGASNASRPIADGRRPDLIIIPMSTGLSFRGYLDELLEGGGYQTTKLRVPDIPYGNIPEPRDHRCVTPAQTQEFWVMLRADHFDRLGGIPLDPAELTQRWMRVPAD